MPRPPSLPRHLQGSRGGGQGDDGQGAGKTRKGAEGDFDKVEAITSNAGSIRLLIYRPATHGSLREGKEEPDAADVKPRPASSCRLVDEVVYWNTTRSPGLTMRLAACAINAASWKPDRMSFSLPG